MRRRMRTTRTSLRALSVSLCVCRMCSWEIRQKESPMSQGGVGEAIRRRRVEERT
jgi:hypothetical protein